MSGEILMPDITLSNIKKNCSDLKKMGISEIHLTGGEPLLNQQIFDIIKYLCGAGFQVKIQTNGYLININTAKKLKKLGVDHILISIDGLSSSHNVFRNNKNAFNRAINAVKICLGVGINTRVNTVLHKNNLQEINQLLMITANIGVHQHSFFYLTPIGRGRYLSNDLLSLEEWRNIKDKIIACAKRLNFTSKVKIQDVFQEQPMQKHHCRIYHKDKCLIMANGNVYPCVFFVNSDYKLGNIHSRGLLEIWNDNKVWEQYYVSHRKKCENLQCTSSCRGLAYLLTGDIGSCDPRCKPEEKLIPSCIRRYIKV
jgi:radical SAM protein with 4Fe4S-binding SPASM domain